MTNRLICGLIVSFLCGSVFAGGVTIRNYSGESVMAVVGYYSILGSCWEAERFIPDGIYVPKSRWGFSGGYYKCGMRENSKNTWSHTRSIYLTPGQSYTQPSSTGDHIMVFATTVQRGRDGGRGLTWHDGESQHRNRNTHWRTVALCTGRDFLEWDRRRSRWEPSDKDGLRSFHPDYCANELKNYLYTDTDTNQYDLVLTRENANREYYR